MRNNLILKKGKQPPPEKYRCSVVFVRGCPKILFTQSPTLLAGPNPILLTLLDPTANPTLRCCDDVHNDQPLFRNPLGLSWTSISTNCLFISKTFQTHHEPTSQGTLYKATWDYPQHDHTDSYSAYSPKTLIIQYRFQLVVPLPASLLEADQTSNMWKRC